MDVFIAMTLLIALANCVRIDKFAESFGATCLKGATELLRRQIDALREEWDAHADKVRDIPSFLLSECRQGFRFALRSRMECVRWSR